MSDFNQDVDTDERFPVPADFTARAHVESLEKYRAMYKASIEESEQFWGDLAREFHWQTPFESVGPVFNFDRTAGPVSIEWFRGGKTNLCYNCLDRHLEAGHGARPALYYECNDVDDEHQTFTYQ